MSFLFPVFLLGGLAAAVPILLHFFARDRAPRLPFSDVRFLERAFVRRDRRRRLRELLLLALRVTALLLLAFAFARPFLDAAGGSRRITVLVVDRSLSLSAPGQMALARRRALELVADAPPDEPIAVVAFDDAAEVVLPPAVGRALVRAAIEGVAPTAGATSHPAGFAAAVELLDGRPGRIVVVTDLQEAGWSNGARVAIPDDVTVEVVAVPQVAGNLAVTVATADLESLAAVILNTGPTPVETAVTLDIDGREVVRRSVTLLPGANEVRWEASTAEAEVAAVSVADIGGYRWDDTRYVLLGPARPTVVHVVANSGTLDAEAFYLARALEAAPRDNRFEARPVAPAAVAALEASAWEAGDVILVTGTDGLSRPARARIAAFVESGGGLFLAVGPGVDPRLIRDVLGEGVDLAVEVSVAAPGNEATSRLAVVDPRHPVFRPFGELLATLGQVRFMRTARVALPERRDGPAGEDRPPRVLARFDQGGPALIEYGPGAGRALVFASDLEAAWNDFPRRSGFVPFLQEAVRYLAGPREPPRDVLPADAPAGVPRVPGVTTVPASGLRVAVNVDPAESEPRPLAPDAFLARLGDSPAGPSVAEPAADGAAREAAQSLWWYVVLAMAAVLLGEAWLGRTMA